MPVAADAPPAPEAARALGDDAGFRLLAQLVAIAPTNVEDPVHGRYEKPNFLRASDAIVRAARSFGLATRVFDPLVAGAGEADLHGLPRPNVIVDLDAGAPSTVLVLAHYDVVPVPAEQLSRWKSPPHTLTYRENGRLYGRGANDDLGSGVVGSLMAMRRLAEAERLPHNVRLIAACDEETGGEGGIESIKAHDLARAPDDPERFLRADVALIPDGSPEVTAGSSGVAFLDGSFARPPSVARTLAYGDALVGLHDVARGWRSVYASPDWPDRHAPDPVITGRATVTRFDWTAPAPTGSELSLVAAHAENDAANQIARAVTLVFAGPAIARAAIRARLEPLLAAPFRLVDAGPTALAVPPDALALQLIGEAAHGGYPHRGHNPVPAALRLLRAAVDRGWIDGTSVGAATFSVDLRLIPEMELADGLRAALAYATAWGAAHDPSVRLEAPPGRVRPGYSLPVDHPAVQKLARILADTLGAHGVFGEYGGTDASALRGLGTPSGAPLPALVFGSMDPAANIHDAEESADPRLIAGVAASIERYVREP